MPGAGADEFPAFLTAAEVATILRVDVMTVYRLIKAKRLTAARVGRAWRITKDSVHAYLDTSEVQA